MSKFQQKMEYKMTLHSERIVFPEGDWQEAPGQLRIDAVVDPNGYPLRLPLPSSRVLAFRVYRISTVEKIGEEIRCYHLEQLTINDLQEYL